MNQTHSASALVVAGVVGMALQLAACQHIPSHSQGAVGKPPTTGPSGSAVGYSTCVRSHGVPTFPDPDSDGRLPKVDAQQLGVSSSRLQAAQHACQHLLPDNGGPIDAGSIDQCMNLGDCPQALVHEVLGEERQFARCLRSQGVPNWPDPSLDSQGRPVFVISISKLGFDPYSPRVWAKGNLCSHLMPNLPGLPAAVSP